MSRLTHFSYCHKDRVDVIQLNMHGHHLKPVTGLLLTASKDSNVKYWDIKR